MCICGLMCICVGLGLFLISMCISIYVWVWVCLYVNAFVCRYVCVCACWNSHDTCLYCTWKIKHTKTYHIWTINVVASIPIPSITVQFQAFDEFCKIIHDIFLNLLISYMSGKNIENIHGSFCILRYIRKSRIFVHLPRCVSASLRAIHRA